MVTYLLGPISMMIEHGRTWTCTSFLVKVRSKGKGQIRTP